MTRLTCALGGETVPVHHDAQGGFVPLSDALALLPAALLVGGD
ncbi:MAG TPA: hypothetical protein VNK43_13270 [Gemmatimonadales bacterium]|nr:hypothetical protein [Gemmatimonadales bacterium]